MCLPPALPGEEAPQEELARFGVELAQAPAAHIDRSKTGTFPNDEEFAAAEMAAEIFEEGDEFGGADGAVDELEVDIPEGNARHGGELVPCA